MIKSRVIDISRHFFSHLTGDSERAIFDKSGLYFKKLGKLVFPSVHAGCLRCTAVRYWDLGEMMKISRL